MNLISKEEEEKIMDLLLSNEPANDVIAFEIIKQLEDWKNFYLPLFAILLLTKKTNY